MDPEAEMKFKTVLTRGKTKNVTGIVVPAEVVEALGGGKRAPVRITINGYAYRSTLAVMGGKCMVGVAAEHREKAGVEGGDTIEVSIELDAAPREVELPPDLVTALAKAKVRAQFDALAYSVRKEQVRSIEEAKAAETRQRRIERAVQKAGSVSR
jgi:uncharacterized protein DUF1905/bacteriocin resistance YdeI/OmpD-like protein